MRKILINALAVIALLIGTMASLEIAKPDNAFASLFTCTAYADNPHISTGAGGIIAKGRWTCTTKPRSIAFTLTLWVCPKPPTGYQNSWRGQGCTVKASAAGTFTYNGTQITRYVPATGAAHGRGYWKMCNTWFVQPDNSDVEEIHSQAVYINA